MAFGLQEETIGLLIVIAVVLITLVTISLHEKSQNRSAKGKSSKEQDKASLKANQPDLGHRQPRERHHEPMDTLGGDPPKEHDQPQLRQQPMREQQTIGTEDFIRNRLLPLLPSFQDKCKQCAAIMLFTHEDVDNLERFDFKPPQVDPDLTKECDPEKVHLDNYIISRSTEHAEKILLDNFDSLKKAFKVKNGGKAAKIVFYIHYMPHSAHILEIIGNFSSLAAKGIQVEMYYTADNNFESINTQRENCRQLEEYKISIDKVHS